MKKRHSSPSRKVKKNKPVKQLIEPRHSGGIILLVWTAIALFA
jgi:hypothetical protein